MTHCAVTNTATAPISPRVVVAASWLQRGRPGLKLSRAVLPAR